MESTVFYTLLFAATLALIYPALVLADDNTTWWQCTCLDLKVQLDNMVIPDLRPMCLALNHNTEWDGKYCSMYEPKTASLFVHFCTKAKGHVHCLCPSHPIPSSLHPLAQPKHKQTLARNRTRVVAA
ncbi:hypothetical protein H4219_005301 [Mycoemilia scoparia]|uniref:Uncharacterized protein n=1 Tax=Mycoemilia scoparia TaxID=417184 RepID=A0A9W7ZWP8_9FUNG|nr:hypothetical protein H4219_005301 [Mycoemilia scoparia]